MNLVTAMAKRRTLVRSVPAEGGYLEAFDVSRDGRWIASSDHRSRMHLYDAATNRLLRSYDAGGPSGDGEGFLVARFSPDSRQLAVILEGAESTEPVRLLDPNTMQPTTKLAFPGRKPVWGIDVQFSADGRYLAATVQTVDWPSKTPAKPRATRWSGTSAPRPRAPSGCLPEPTSRGWRSARTAGPCTRPRR